MLTYTTRWSHPPGNAVVPSPWQATAATRGIGNATTSFARHSTRPAAVVPTIDDREGLPASGQCRLW